MTTKKLLITGASGFVGQAIYAQADALRARCNIVLASLPGAVDIRKASDIQSALQAELQSGPIDYVLHLAALSHVQESIDKPNETLAVNVEGTTALLNALGAVAAHQTIKPRLIFVSSGDIYGVVTEADLPVTETQPPRPRNPYSISKIAAEHIALSWGRAGLLDVMVARPFNHTGPGQTDRFALARFAKQVAQIKLNKRDANLQCGDIDVTRDFLDVRDVISAYVQLFQTGKNTEIYNICSGVELQLRDAIAELADIAQVTVTPRMDPSAQRSGEQRRVRGDNQKLLATGWSPQVTRRELLKRLYEYWLAQ